MNHLALIKEGMQKRARLSEAQRLMAKAYRGVEYVDAVHDRPKKDGQTDLVYRGISYQL
jgi:hypothetical protein